MILSLMLLMIGQALQINTWYYILLAMVFLWKMLETAFALAGMMKE